MKAVATWDADTLELRLYPENRNDGAYQKLLVLINEGGGINLASADLPDQGAMTVLKLVPAAGKKGETVTPTVADTAKPSVIVPPAPASAPKK